MNYIIQPNEEPFTICFCFLILRVMTYLDDSTVVSTILDIFLDFGCGDCSSDLPVVSDSVSSLVRL